MLDALVCPSQKNPKETRKPTSRLKLLLTQQAEMIQMMMQQMKDLNARVGVAEEEFAKAAAQGGGTAQNGDAEMEGLEKLPYMPHVAGNLFPKRPASLVNDMPKMCDLYDKTYDALSKRTNFSQRYQ